MDIAIVTTRLVDRDAQGNFTAASLAELKARHNGRVALYTFAYERPPIDGVEVRFLGGVNGHGIGTNVRAFLRTLKTAKELAAYDRLVLAGPDVGALPAIHRARKLNPAMKLVWVYHGLTPPGQLAGIKDRLLTRARKEAYASSMKRSDRIKTDSRHSKDELAGWGVDPAKITVIPIGTDLSRFSPGSGEKVRAALGIGDRFLLLYVGRLASGKRVDNLLRAMAMMKNERVALIVVGGGPERERLDALARELDVADAVRFAGRVPDEELPDYYRACDVWVTASEHEGFCVPIVEAMATGKPVIVPDVTAMPETGGDAGMTYQGGDLAAFTRQVEALMSDRSLYDTLAGHALRQAPGFSMDTVIERYVSFILQGDA
ncbi:MAG TPA: glycosyltransferase family 1 protein [Methanocella sp.]